MKRLLNEHLPIDKSTSGFIHSRNSRRVHCVVALPTPRTPVPDFPPPVGAIRESPSPPHAPTSQLDTSTLPRVDRNHTSNNRQLPYTPQL